MSNSDIVIKAIHQEMERLATPGGQGLRALAREKGITPSHLHDVINGRRGISLRIAGAFGFVWGERGWKRVRNGG
jgi:hypothetical protein